MQLNQEHPTNKYTKDFNVKHTSALKYGSIDSERFTSNFQVPVKLIDILRNIKSKRNNDFYSMI